MQAKTNMCQTAKIKEVRFNVAFSVDRLNPNRLGFILKLDQLC